MNRSILFLIPFFLLITCLTNTAFSARQYNTKNGTYFATDDGMYMGLNVGEASIDLSDVTEKSSSTVYSPDGDSVGGIGLMIGYNASKYFGMEFGGAYLSDLDYDGSNAPTRSQYFMYLAFKPMVRINNVELFAKLGGAYLYSDYDFTSDDDDDEIESNNVDPMYAVGIGYHSSATTEIALSYTKIPDNEGDLTYTAIELIYHFVTLRNSAGFLVDDTDED